MYCSVLSNMKPTDPKPMYMYKSNYSILVSKIENNHN